MSETTPESPYTDRQARFMVRRIAALVLLWPLQGLASAVVLWRLAGHLLAHPVLSLSSAALAAFFLYIHRSHLGLMRVGRRQLRGRLHRTLLGLAPALPAAYVLARMLQDPALGGAFGLQMLCALAALEMVWSLDRCGLLPAQMSLREALGDWEKQSAQAMRLRRQAQKAQKAADLRRAA